VDWRKLSPSISLKHALAGFGTSVIVGVFLYYGRPVFVELNESFAIREFKSIGIVATYRKHYHHFFDTIDHLATADAQQATLVRELASVQKELEIEKEKNTESVDQIQTKQIADRLNAEAGSSLARIPDGIDYKVPSQILPHQLQVLGMEYFRKQDYEKSAVIFHELTHMKEDAGFQRADNYLISAISWYQLKYYEMAADYLVLTQKLSEPGSEIYRESIIWQSILEKARGNLRASQQALTRLVTLYPQSEEVAWINQGRIPASRKSVEATEKKSENKNEKKEEEKVHE